MQGRKPFEAGSRHRIEVPDGVFETRPIPDRDEPTALLKQPGCPKSANNWADCRALHAQHLGQVLMREWVRLGRSRKAAAATGRGLIDRAGMSTLQACSIGQADDVIFAHVEIVPLDRSLVWKGRCNGHLAARQLWQLESGLRLRRQRLFNPHGLAVDTDSDVGRGHLASVRDDQGRGRLGLGW